MATAHCSIDELSGGKENSVPSGGLIQTQRGGYEKIPPPLYNIILALFWFAERFLARSLLFSTRK